jgi:hypothetical protein
MHGHERSVERKIRLWIVRHERDQRKDGRPGRIKARGDAPVERSQRAAHLSQRGRWQ